MNVNFFKWSIAVVAAFTTTHSLAEPVPDWVSSYNANGSCYCAPEVHPSLVNKIVATPVGGQSIGQVCGRIGDGPELKLDNDKFNFPTYHDAQCGNGPIGTGPDAQGCEGRTQNDDSVCTGTGPEWDLKSAYAKPAKAAKPKAAEPVATKAAADSAAQKAAKAASVKKRAAIAQAKREREDAALARKLAAEARAKSEKESEVRQQKLAQKSAEKAKSASLAQAKADAAKKANSAQAQADRTNRRLAEETRKKRAKALAAQNKARAQKLADEKALAEKEAVQQKAEKDKADKIRIAAEKAARIRADAKAKKEAQAKKEADELLANSAAVEKVETGAEPVIESGTGTGLRLPTYASMSNGHTGFVEVAPVTYDFGGAGASVAGGYIWAPSWQFTGRAAVVEEYTEVMLGIRKSFDSEALRGARINILAGFEHGNFDLGITELSDSGVILGSSVGYNVGRRANLSAGVKYSSFFEGDPGVFGLFLFRVVESLDFSTRVESGDNANFSLGLRYHY